MSQCSGTAEMLAKWIGAEEKQVRYPCAGINHQAFYLDFEVDGKDAYPDLYKAIEREEVAAEEPVRIEMFKKLGYFNTESSGHNSEYVAWFRKRPDLIENIVLTEQDGIRERTDLYWMSI